MLILSVVVNPHLIGYSYTKDQDKTTIFLRIRVPSLIVALHPEKFLNKS